MSTLSAAAQLAPLVTGRIRSLDGIRGLAISMVIVHHYVAQTVVTDPGTLGAYALALLRLSWSGVDLFFVLSGYLICGILLDAKSSPRYFRTFYGRRFYRIAPAYALLLCLYIIIGAVAPRTAEWARLLDTTVPFWSYPLFLQNLFMGINQTWGPLLLGVSWSLAVEEQFYLVLPALVRALSRRRLLCVSICSFFLAPIIRTLLYLSGNRDIGPYVLLPCRADALAIGVMLALAVRHPEYRLWIEARAAQLKCALAAFAAGFILLTIANRDFIKITIGYSWLAVLYGLLLLFASQRSGLGSRVLSGALLPQLGVLAYGLYLFHHPILTIAHASLFHAMPRSDSIANSLLTALCLALAVLVAAVSWKWIESPLVRSAQRRFHY